MISKVLIILSSGILCYSKTLFGTNQIDEDFVSAFLTATIDISKKIGGGEIRSLNFRNFNIIYSYDNDKRCIFILLADINDPEEKLRNKLELLKKEFIKRYHDDLINWDHDIGKFESFDEFVEKHIFIPPIILLVGEDGVGKTTIMNLFAGETIIELDEDMREVIQKSIFLPDFKSINECILREINLKELVDNSRSYRQLLDSIDIICLVTNSGATNISKTQKLFLSLRPKVKKATFFVIANFQDLDKVSLEPEEVEEIFGVRTFGFSAKSKDAENKIFSIIKEMLNNVFEIYD
ncbi:MAG: GTPase domain-containing protein [Promethearchaeota archaeon]